MRHFKDGSGRKLLRWNFDKSDLVEIPEAERVVHEPQEIKELKAKWKQMTTEEKISFLAQRLGIEDI